MRSAAAFSAFHWAFLAAGCLTAAVYDIAKRRVPNWLTVALLASGLAARGLSLGLVSAAWGLAGAAVGLAILLFPFARGWVGGGDVKLLAAVGAWLGPWLVLEATLAAAIVGGVVSVGFLLSAPREVRREMLENLRFVLWIRRMPQVAVRPARYSPPYAPAIALGAAFAVLAHAEKLLVR